MRQLCRAAVAAVMFGVASVSAADQPGSTTALPRHVRTSDEKIARLLEAGMARSSTLSRLVAALDASDVIVYVEPQQRHLERYGGYLVHEVVVTGGYRYLRVMLQRRGPENLLIARLAHELAHAKEVADSADARDGTSVRRLFERIGIYGACFGLGSCRETRGALEAQRVVLRELKEAARPESELPPARFADSRCLDGGSSSRCRQVRTTSSVRRLGRGYDASGQATVLTEPPTTHSFLA